MTQMNVVSLFTGAGGLDYGLEAAGWDVCAAIEMDADCCSTIRANRDWPLIEADLNATSSRRIMNTAGLSVGEAFLLTGGPPCQPFSKSAYWANGDTRRLDDPRANTLSDYMRCVADMLPAVFLLENVHGLNYSGKEEGFEWLQRLTDSINDEKGTNYVLCWRVLDTADYGVPQSRRRFFVVAHREGRRFRFPEPTHGDPSNDQLALLGTEQQAYVTAWDAIGDLEEEPCGRGDLAARGKWADLLPSIPEGENYLWHTDRKGGLPLFGWRTRYWSFLLKLAKRKPSWTIQAQPGPAVGPFHWKSRLLSIREMARLQCFPDYIRFRGNRRSVQRQIGNAVPSLMGEVLGRAIAEQFFGAAYLGEPILSMATHASPPPPEPVAPVPEKYLDLVGDHRSYAERQK